MRALSLAGLLAAAALAVPAAAHAEVYKWVDEKGSVTYGNVPPPNAKKVTQLDESSGRVSTVPGLSPEELARQRQLALELRLQRLEQELYDQRMRATMPAAQPYPSYPYGDYYGPGYAYGPGYSYGYGGFAWGPTWWGRPVGTRFVRHPIRVQHPIVVKSPVRVARHR